MEIKRIENVQKISYPDLVEMNKKVLKNASMFSVMLWSLMSESLAEVEFSNMVVGLLSYRDEVNFPEKYPFVYGMIVVVAVVSLITTIVYMVRLIKLKKKINNTEEIEKIEETKSRIKRVKTKCIVFGVAFVLLFLVCEFLADIIVEVIVY